MIVERTHDPAHIDALELGLERHRARHARLQGQDAAPPGAHPDRQAEIRHADLLDADVRSLNGPGCRHHVRHPGAVGGSDRELRIVAARNPSRSGGFGAMQIEVGFGLHSRSGSRPVAGDTSPATAIRKNSFLI